jgi:hypothetical protein
LERFHKFLDNRPLILRIRNSEKNHFDILPGAVKAVDNGGDNVQKLLELLAFGRQNFVHINENHYSGSFA